jgi:hypothetical protein
MPVERRGLTVDKNLIKTEGEPLERRTFHYGRTGRGKDRPEKGREAIAGETRRTETETRPKGETGAEVSVLRIV